MNESNGSPERSYPCPADRTVLQEPQAEGTIRRCPQCEGVLFSNARLLQMVKNNGFDLLKLRPDAQHTRPCPGCTSDMRSYDLDGIEIDLCPLCVLVWMDKGEFPKVQAHLEKERRERATRGPTPAYSDTGTLGHWTDYSDGHWRMPTMFDVLFDSLWNSFFRRW